MSQELDSKSVTSMVNNEDDVEEKKENKKCSSIGIFLTVIAGLSFSFNTILVKFIPLPAIQLSFIRCAMQVLIVLPIITYKMFKENMDIMGSRKLFTMLLARGVIGSSTAMMLYQAIQRISVGDAISIAFLNVFVAGLIAYVWLKEPYSLFDGLLALIAVSGVILIAKPTFIFGQREDSYGPEGIIGIIFALLTAFLIGVVASLIRKLSTEKIQAVLSVFYYSICGTVIAGIATFTSNSFEMPCQSHLIYILLLGITGLFGQLFLAQALFYERTTTVSVLKSMDIVFALVLQVSWKYYQRLMPLDFFKHYKLIPKILLWVKWYYI